MGLYGFQTSVHLLSCIVVIEGENSRYGKDIFYPTPKRDSFKILLTLKHNILLLGFQLAFL